MLREKPFTSGSDIKPRKLLKLDVLKDKNYNQFQGNSQMQIQQYIETDHTKQQNEQKFNSNKVSYQEQIKLNQKVYDLISKQHSKFKKVGAGEMVKQDKQDKSHRLDKNNKTNNQNNKVDHQNHQNVKVEGLKPKNQISQVKVQEQVEIIQVNCDKKQQLNLQKNDKKAKNQQNSKPKQKQLPSSNWAKFLQKSTTQNTKSKSKSKVSIQSSQFVAIDCQFVKCGQKQQLARISLVSQTGITIYDSYIKPQQRVSDYITTITGITHSHLKNAPLWKDVISQVKKILLGKILVGHTVHKDLEVSGLTGWKGIAAQIDIALFAQYKDKHNGKAIGLKKLSADHLNRNIQLGWHSSVEDSLATIDLFKLHKKKILKENKLI